MAQKEIWQTLEFDEFKFKKRYQISNLGRVMSSMDSPQIDGIILKQKEIKGVKAIGLKFYNTSKSYFIHKLVAMNFCKKPSPEHCFVIHLDHNKNNNKASNLKWVTYKESVEHTKKAPNTLNTAQRNILNTGKFGKVLTEKKVQQLKEAIFNPKRTLTLKQLAKKFGISEMTLYRIKRGELWYTVRVQGEPKNKKLKQYKKVKKERKAINKKSKHVTT
jgi:hypothetical protein